MSSVVTARLSSMSAEASGRDMLAETQKQTQKRERESERGKKEEEGSIELLLDFQCLLVLCVFYRFEFLLHKITFLSIENIFYNYKLQCLEYILRPINSMSRDIKPNERPKVIFIESISLSVDGNSGQFEFPIHLHKILL